LSTGRATRGAYAYMKCKSLVLEVLRSPCSADIVRLRDLCLKLPFLWFE
jgi:hypothetical protein